MPDKEPEEFLDRLHAADRAALAAGGRHRRWPAGSSLFLEGDQSSTVL